MVHSGEGFDSIFAGNQRQLVDFLKFVDRHAKVISQQVDFLVINPDVAGASAAVATPGTTETQAVFIPDRLRHRLHILTETT